MTTNIQREAQAAIARTGLTDEALTSWLVSLPIRYISDAAGVEKLNRTDCQTIIRSAVGVTPAAAPVAEREARVSYPVREASGGPTYYDRYTQIWD